MRSFMEQYNWDERILYYTFAYNTTPHTTTGFSLFELVYGRLAPMSTEPMPNEKNLRLCYRIRNKIKTWP